MYVQKRRCDVVDCLVKDRDVNEQDTETEVSEVHAEDLLLSKY